MRTIAIEINAKHICIISIIQLFICLGMIVYKEQQFHENVIVYLGTNKEYVIAYLKENGLSEGNSEIIFENKNDISEWAKNPTKENIPKNIALFPYQNYFLFFTLLFMFGTLFISLIEVENRKDVITHSPVVPEVIEDPKATELDLKITELENTIVEIKQKLKQGLETNDDLKVAMNSIKDATAELKGLMIFIN